MSPKRRNLSAVFLGSRSAFDATSPPLANRLAFESLTAVEFPGRYDERTNNTGKFKYNVANLHQCWLSGVGMSLHRMA